VIQLQHSDDTPLAELKRNFVAALAVLVVVSFGAFCVVALLGVALN
jgi:succinate dehydrogenase hydrophobic anchor subunit